MRAEELSKEGIPTDAELDALVESTPPSGKRRSIGANLGGGSTYFVFGCINFIAIIFFVKFVPETKNHSLEELEIHFQEQYS